MDRFSFNHHHEKLDGLDFLAQGCGVVLKKCEGRRAAWSTNTESPTLQTHTRTYMKGHKTMKQG